MGDKRAHLQVLNVCFGRAGPNFLHHGRNQVVSLKHFGAEGFAALGAGDRSLNAPPIPGDARFAEMVHAGQHYGVTEKVAAYSAGQVVPQAAFGGQGWGSGGGGCSSSHGEGWADQFQFCGSGSESVESGSGAFPF